MNYDQYGQCWSTPEELFELLYQDPTLNLGNFHVKIGGEKSSKDLLQYQDAIKDLFVNFDCPKAIREIHVPVEEFDNAQQSNWYMPNEYKNLDIAQYILDQCKSDAELQRVGQELLLYQERNLFDLLRYLKYFVDTMRKNNVVWGLGRGSSVASFVLYLLGVHKINSLYYDLPIEEFLK